MSVSLGEAISLGQTGRITPDKVAPSLIHGADQAMRMDFAKARAEEKAKADRQKQIDALAGKLDLQGGYNSHYVDAATKLGSTAALDYGNALKNGNTSQAMQIQDRYNMEAANLKAQNDELNNFLKTDDSHIVPNKLRDAFALPKSQGQPQIAALIKENPSWENIVQITPEGNYKLNHIKSIDMNKDVYKPELSGTDMQAQMLEKVGRPYKTVGGGTDEYGQSYRMPSKNIAEIANRVASDHEKAFNVIYNDEAGYKKAVEEVKAHQEDMKALYGKNAVDLKELTPEEIQKSAVNLMVSRGLEGHNRVERKDTPHYAATGDKEKNKPEFGKTEVSTPEDKTAAGAVTQYGKDFATEYFNKQTTPSYNQVLTDKDGLVVGYKKISGQDIIKNPDAIILRGNVETDAKGEPIVGVRANTLKDAITGNQKISKIAEQGSKNIGIVGTSTTDKFAKPVKIDIGNGDGSVTSTINQLQYKHIGGKTYVYLPLDTQQSPSAPGSGASIKEKQSEYFQVNGTRIGQQIRNLVGEKRFNEIVKKGEDSWKAQQNTPAQKKELSFAERQAAKKKK